MHSISFLMTNTSNSKKKMGANINRYNCFHKLLTCSTYIVGKFKIIHNNYWNLLLYCI